jgi:hypothetical protein
VSKSLLIVDSYYSALLHRFGFDVPPGPESDYGTDLERLVSIGFGTGDAYRRAFRHVGWNAEIVVPNSLTLQTQWMREHGQPDPIAAGWGYAAHASRVPLMRDRLHWARHLHRVLLEQVRATRPDVLLIQDINLVTSGFARALKKHVGVLVGEIASPPPPKSFFISYDIVISALPSIVDAVHAWGVRSEYLPLGFDDRWTVSSAASSRQIDAVFVGSFSRLQPATAPLLRAVAELVPGLEIYGTAAPDVLAAAGLEGYYRGEAWGADMFRILGNSKLVVNRHGAIAGDYAVNMRMYETTGTGAALITENKRNLATLFEPNVEVLAYDDIHEAARLASGLLADPARLDSVAAAGHARTMSKHTYVDRAKLLAEIIEDLPGV